MPQKHNQNSNQNSNITKQDFLDAIEEFNLATLVDLDKAMRDHTSKIFQVFATKQYILDNFVTKDELHESTNKILTAIDKIHKIVKRNDQEQTVISHKVTNHESRITKIEKVILAN